MSSRKKTIKALLEEIMERKGIRPEHLAKNLGVSSASVSRWISGKDIPSSASCYKLAEYAEISIEKILYMAGQIPYKPGEDTELP